MPSKDAPRKEWLLEMIKPGSSMVASVRVLLYLNCSLGFDHTSTATE